MRLSLHLHRALHLSAALLPGITLAQTNSTADSNYATPYTFSAANAWGLPPIGSQDGVANAVSFFHPSSTVTDSKGDTFVADTGNCTIREILSDGTVSTFAGRAGVAGSVDAMGAAARFTNPAGMAIDSSDNLYVSDAGNFTIRKITPAGAVTTLAGVAGQSGCTDGTGTGARFYFPVGITLNPSGSNLYVADAGNNTIRKITTTGGVVTTLNAGVNWLPSTGYTDATGTAARFDLPYNTAVDKSGNIYVSDASNHVIRKITPAGVVTTVAGTAGVHGSVDGPSTGGALFFYPAAVALGNDGSIFVADSSNDTVRKIDTTGNVTTVAGMAEVPGVVNGIGTSAQFNHPTSLAIDGSGNIYVSDTYNHAIRKIDSTRTVTTFAGVAGYQGFLDATGTAARFNFPSGLAVDGNGNIYEAEAASEVIRKITPGGVVTTVAGFAGNAGSVDGTGTAARFNSPAGVSVDGANNVYVADTFSCSIRKITPAGVVSTLAGTPELKGHTDGAGSIAQFNFPYGVTVDSADNTLVVADTYNNTIRKISQTNVVSTVAGAPGNAGFVDNCQVFNAEFDSPSGIAADSNGNLYVADSGNNSIRKIDSSSYVTTYAGGGRLRTVGFSDGDARSVARFNSPSAVAVDSTGDVCVADTGNDTIRMIVNDGTTVTVETLAGAPLTPGRQDGTGGAALFQNPSGISINNGTIYVADTGSNAIRTIATPSDVVSTLAGQITNQGSADGQGSAARFYYPSGAAWYNGSLYVADPGNDVIRHVDLSTNMVTTYAGQDGVIDSLDGSGTAVAFANPRSVAVDAGGNVYVSDSTEYNIRMIVPATGNTPVTVSTLAGSASASGITDGSGTAALFSVPIGVAVSGNATNATANVYIVDSANNLIRRIVVKPGTTTNGVVTTLAGVADVAGSIDGTGTAAEFNLPQAIAIDSTGNTLYVADTGNQMIRMIKLTWSTDGTTPTAKVSTLAGIVGTRGTINGAGSTAQFDNPASLTLDSTGNNLYVADANGEVIRKIAITTAADGTTTSQVTTVAGIPSSPGYTDGAGPTARFNRPTGLTIDPAGNLYVVDTHNSELRKVTPPSTSSGPWQVSTIAGVPSYASFGDADGPSGVARFSEPYGVAVDTDGNIYVGDTDTNTVRKIDTSGNVTTIAGVPQSSGSVEGTGAAAQLSLPYGVAVDKDKFVYVADAINSTIRRIDPGGFVKTIAGTAGLRGSLDGTGSDAQFYMPTSVAVDSAKNVYVADTNNSTIRKITPSGSDGSLGIVTTLAGLSGSSGYWDAAGSDARFSTPNGVAVDGAGNVYVADTGNNVVRKITPGGLVTTLAGSPQNAGSVDGTGTDAWFSGPTAVAVDAKSYVYVADSDNHLIRQITPGGVVTTLAGAAGVVGYVSGTGSEVRFNTPNGIAVDSSGNVYVADTQNNIIRVGKPPSGAYSNPGAAEQNSNLSNTGSPNSSSNSSGSSGTSGSGSSGSSGSSGTSASSTGVFLFIYPTSVARDGSGNLYVADTANNTIQQVTPAGVVTTLAGTAAVVGSTDAHGTNALFNQPNGVALDGSGNIFIADTGNGTIRKIDSQGTVTTFAGSASNRGNRDGAGTAAWFSAPTGIAADSAGNLYVADAFTETIRKINSNGTVTTLAGAATVRGHANGTGTSATFNYPTGVAVDGSGNLYVADSYNDTIRKITSAGAVTTLAGDYQISGSVDGTGSNAYFNQPAGLAVDGVGDVYVADSGNCTIRSITPDGTVKTVAGYAGLAGLLDGAGTNALFNQPRGLVLDGSGNIYVADSGNAAIRKISVNATVSTPAMTQGSTTGYTSSIPKGQVGGGTDSSSSGGGGGGGGGAVNPWFAGLLALLGISRWFTRKR